MTTIEKRRNDLISMTNGCLRRVQRVAKLTGSAATAVTTNNLNGLKDGFEDVLNILKDINVERVIFLRKNKEDTTLEWRNKISICHDKVENYSYTGISGRIKELINDKVIPNSAHKDLTDLNKLRQKLQQALSIAKYRYLQFLTSWWLWGAVLLIALISIPLFYLVILHNPDENLGALVQHDVHQKAQTIRAIAEKPGQSFLDKATEISKQLSQFVHTIPKLLAGIGVAIAAAQKLIISVSRKTL